MESRDDSGPDPQALIAPEGLPAFSGGRASPSPIGERGNVPDDAPVIDASQLFGRHRQVIIGHNGCRYVLRITKHGKLILNK